MKRCYLLMPLMAARLIPAHSISTRRATQIQGLHGHITQAIGGKGVDATTLSQFGD